MNNNNNNNNNKHIIKRLKIKTKENPHGIKFIFNTIFKKISV